MAAGGDGGARMSSRAGQGGRSPGGDPFDLARFVSAQDRVYADALAEVRGGRKRTHWMWFIFPQIEGLGFSATSMRYAVRGLPEARAYLAHPVLGPRLRECAEAVLAVEGREAQEIFPYPDDLKLRSSMTLFALVDGPRSVFERVLDKYFQGRRDERTLQLAR
jgi:uncharacterized protein (DUF1810 family)